MTIRWNRLGLAVFVLLLSAGWPGLRPAAAADDTIVSRTAQIEGVTLHYLTAGQGPPLILLHGYTQTSRMWRPIMPRLAEKFMVIAPDLPGIGDSGIPATGLARPGRMRAGWAYFAAWPRTATEFAELARTRLTVPVLVIGGEKSMGSLLADQAKLVAPNVTGVLLKDTGHWVLEERRDETTEALVRFLGVIARKS